MGEAPEARRPRVVVDQTHVRGHVTGIERVALDLFSADALAPFEVEPVRSRGLLGMLLQQQVGLPARLARERDAVFVFPGFPPGLLATALGRRCITYVHDTFLLTRPADLSWKARLYMAPSFALAVRHGRRFLANSETTAADLRRFTRPGAEVALLRPPARDVFGLAALPGRPSWRPGEPLRLLAIGTIEPRKDYPAALAVVAALNAGGLPATLDLVGRVGWGDHPWLAAPPSFLRLHHGLDDAGVRAVAAGSHAFLCTSKAEGLGLPLLEVQHGGLPVIAPRGEVFAEVLAGSGLHIVPTDPAGAAASIRAWALDPAGLPMADAASRANVARWARLAAADAASFRAALAGGL